MTRYQRVLWHHDLPNEPTELYSEIEDGLEVRKIEVYRDGRRDYADRIRSTGTTMLGAALVPSIEEINQDAEFSATVITQQEFEMLWQAAISGS